MNLLQFEYRGHTYYRVFEQVTHFNTSWIESVKMKPELVKNAVWLATSRPSYPDKNLMKGL